jgi:hypothetical protein
VKWRFHAKYAETEKILHDVRVVNEENAGFKPRKGDLGVFALRYSSPNFTTVMKQAALAALDRLRRSSGITFTGGYKKRKPLIGTIISLKDIFTYGDQPG